MRPQTFIKGIMQKLWLAVLLPVAFLVSAKSSCRAEVQTGECDSERSSLSVSAGWNISASEGSSGAPDFVRLTSARDLSARSARSFELAAGNHLNKDGIAAVSALVSYSRTFLKRDSFDVSWEVAAGVVYFNEHVAGQATRLNFTEHLGLLVQTRARHDRSFFLDYRFCHVSNANLRRPNQGINTQYLMLGARWYR